MSSYRNECHVSLLSRLELVKHDVERCVVEDKVHFVIVKLTDHRQRHIVVRVNEHQVLEENVLAMVSCSKAVYLNVNKSA